MRHVRADDTLAVLGRMLARLQRNDPEHAIARLSEATPESLHGHIAELQALSSGVGLQDVTHLRAGHPHAGLARLLARARAAGAEAMASLVAFEDTRWRLSPTLDGTRAEMKAITSYLAALSAVAAMVLVIAAIFLMPGFAEMFGSFGSGLPALTRLVFGYGGLFGYLGILIMAVTVGTLLLFAFDLDRASRSMISCPPRWRRVPLIKRLVATHDNMVMLVYARALSAGGLDAKQATAIARDLVSPAAQQDHARLNSAAALDLAERLGQFDAELDFQFAVEFDTAALRFHADAAVIAAVAKVLIYVFVGLLVIAIYLPIFAMGTLV